MTDKEKIKIYEDFLHKINMYCTTCNDDGIGKLIQNANTWSYSHRVGNGELSDERQNELIEESTRKLLNV